VPIEAFVPYDKGELLNDIHKVGMVEKTVSDLFDHLKKQQFTSKIQILLFRIMPQLTQSFLNYIYSHGNAIILIHTWVPSEAWTVNFGRWIQQKRYT
jgi:hypothetical protein